MEEKGVYLAIQTPRQVRKKPMYKNGMYRETDKMSDLICENYPMVLVMSRFGIALGFGEKNIGEVCRQNGVDAYFPDGREFLGRGSEYACREYQQMPVDRELDPLFA
jgi:hypothetical protein